jgi:hypothetical protein
MQANAANGGWVASVEEMIQFLIGMDERSAKPLLSAAMLKAISDNVVPGSGEAGSGAYQGLGWLVRPRGEGGRPNFWHVGGLPGTKALMARLGNGFNWVVLFNLRPASLDAVNQDITNTIHAAASRVWPG